MNLERVTRPGQVAAVAELAREIWTQHYVPIVGMAQVGYMLARFQSAEAIAFYELVTDIGGGFVMDDWRMAKRLSPRKASRQG